ncbi:MAG: hypothetical protein ACK574_03745 [Bacteroidota bacterium]
MIRTILAALAISAVVFGGCRKTEEDPLNNGGDLIEFSLDENMFSNETELLFNDIAKATEETGLGKGPNIPGATVNDSTFIGMKKIIVTYNGNSADGQRFRTGTLSIQLIEGTKWTNAGSVIRIDVDNIRITKNGTSNSMTVQGTYYIKNLTGGRAFVAANVQHKLWGGATIGFINGQATVWNISRKRTFENNSGVLSLKAEGDTSVNGETNVIVWGKNRRGVAFTVINNEPVMWSSTCPTKVMSGKRTVKGFAADITIIHGVNSDGTPTTSGCPYGYKLEWKNKSGEDRSTTIAY